MSQAPENDGERTIVRPSPGKGGQRAASVQLVHTLPNGTRIRDYEITGLIGEGGFGIVYLAYDHSLQRSVAIKEYMPSSMASRVNESATVIVKSDRHQETFKAGLKSFVNEARLLARFDHPALVKVYRFWEENGTAYMVMPFYEGPTLKSALASMGKVPDEAALRSWLRPLLDALSVMHAAQCYHRDIAPDNILLTATGPLLLDFGAARRVIGDMTHALTVVLKPGYAPIEQYGDVATMSQGAWTDLYALACVVYFAITGKVPMSSVERLMDDRLVPLAKLAAGRYSPAFLGAMDAALAVRPQDRPQTDAQFCAMFDPPESARRAAPATPPMARALPPAPEAAADPVSGVVIGPRSPPAAPLARTTPPRPPAPAPIAPAFSQPFEPSAHPAESKTATHSAPIRSGIASRSERPAIRRKPVYVAGAAVCAIALTAGVVLYLNGRPSTEPGVAATPATASADTTASAAGGTPVVVAEPATTVPMPAPAPVPTPTAPIVVEGPAPAAVPASAPAPTSATSARTAPSPTAEPAVTAPAPATKEPVADPSPPVRTRREPQTRVEAAPATPKAVPSRGAGVQARCSDILQKASLETLTSEEAAFLKGECR